MPGRPPSGSRVSIHTASEWPRQTGTRTHVVLIPISESPRILCVSSTSFVSSSVLSPSNTSHWGSTLNAIWCG